jgi:alpha-ketoglutarate-dependent taurine dioxygenase
MAHLRDELYQRHLLVIRGLAPLHPDELLEFADLFGTVEMPLEGSAVLEGQTLVEVVRRTGQDPEYASPASEPQRGIRIPSSFYWHADRSFLVSPSLVTLAYAQTPAPVGGDTQFLNLELAWRGQDDRLKDRLERTFGIHSYSRYRRELAHVRYSEGAIQSADSLYPTVMHPLLMTHPVTGATIPYLSPLTLQTVVPLVRMRHVEAAMERLLNPESPAFSEAFCSIGMPAGTLLVWDNFGAIHRGTPSFGDIELWRVTLSQP